MKKAIYKLGLWSLILTMFVACKDDEDPTVNDPVSSFQYEVDAGDFFKVQFNDFSQNAESWEWDFGDGNTSTDQNPLHTYAEGGVYTVTLVVSGNEKTDESSKEVTITDPNQALTLLAGSVEKEWKLLREGAAVGVGSSYEAFTQYFSFSNDGNRNCFFDDTFTFTRDGAYIYDDGGSFWGEANVYASTTDKGDLAETCFDATVENLTVDGVDLSAWLSGSYNYDYDVQNSQLTLEGLGVWMGLIKIGTDAEYAVPQESVRMDVVIADGGESGVDTLDVAWVYNPDVTWRARYVSYSDPSLEPAIATATPVPSYTFEVNDLSVTFTNTSKNAESYSWDFGDGNTSTEENPVHTYADVGCYQVTLTADGQGLSESITQEVLVSAPATFDPAILSNANGKIWTLNGVGSYKVGPAPGSGEFYGGPDEAAVTERACQMDDEFIFTDAGVFEYKDQDNTWAEGYMGGSNACVDPATLAAPFDGLAAGVYGFTADATTITVNGEGAFLGWSKAFNGGEYNGSESALQTTITYEVLEYIESPCKEILVIAVEIGGGTYWTVTLKSEN